MYGVTKLTITKAIQKKKTATPIPAALEDWVKTSGATTNPTTPEPEFNPIEKPKNQIKLKYFCHTALLFQQSKIVTQNQF